MTEMTEVRIYDRYPSQLSYLSQGVNTAIHENPLSCNVASIGYVLPAPPATVIYRKGQSPLEPQNDERKGT